jgi:hypothetical protein
MMPGRDRPANNINEIEVTEEMVRAGSSVISAFDRRIADEDDLAVWVFRAMWAAQRKPTSC